MTPTSLPRLLFGARAMSPGGPRPGRGVVTERRSPCMLQATAGNVIFPITFLEPAESMSCSPPHKFASLLHMIYNIRYPA